jgi:hypothetical protein
MSPSHLLRDLEGIGRRLQQWQAACRSAYWAAALLAGLGLFSLSDLLLRYDRPGRVVAWSVLAVGLLAGAAHLWRVLSRTPTPGAVAMRIERTFPQLDNHLINYVLFARHPAPDVLEQAYLGTAIPHWGALDFRALRSRRAQQVGLALLAAAALLLAGPGLWTGAAWGNAVLRILNPFSTRPPVTLTQLLWIEPGNAFVQKGDALTLKCEVKGRGGQGVFLDLWPDDDRSATIQLGRVSGSERETFTYPLARVTTGFRYRFRAGDARSEQFRVESRPPLAFKLLRLKVGPPAYTGLAGRTLDALTEEPTIPQGSRVSVEMQCDDAITGAAWAVEGGAPQPLRLMANGWSGSLTVSSGAYFRVTAADAHRRLGSDVKFQWLPDRPPELRILAPAGRALVTAGATPRIAWEARDDYGLSALWVEKAVPGQDAPGGEPLARWTVPGVAAFATNWAVPPAALAGGVTNCFRVVAVDNAPTGSQHVVRSALVIFELANAATALKDQQQAATNAALTLARLVELQQASLEAAHKLQAVLDQATAEQWQGIKAQQTQIQQTAGELLALPQKPLGPLTETVRGLYHGPMAEVIGVFDRLPAAPDSTNRVILAARGVALQARILRLLTQSEVAAKAIQEHREITGLLALLDVLVSGQGELLDHTRAWAKTSASVIAGTADRQDRLAGDLAEFVAACRREAEAQQRNDKPFADLLVKAADTCETRKVGAEMLKAAEALDQNKAAEAVPPEDRALTCLKGHPSRPEPVATGGRREEDRRSQGEPGRGQGEG